MILSLDYRTPWHKFRSRRPRRSLPLDLPHCFPAPCPLIPDVPALDERDCMKKEMLINVLQPEECRIAIVEDGILEELYVERTSHESYVGNIYKGRIVNIEPSIQAAFVDFGVGRNGFLHVSDVEPTYYRHLLDPRDRARGRDRGRGGDEEDSIYD